MSCHVCANNEETNFSNVLLVQQALGHGVLKIVGSEQKARKKEVEERLGTWLSALFPESKNLQKKLGALVGEAIELANMMTEEKALFLCEMIPSGSRFNVATMNTFDDENGRVVMCMFPAFGVRIRDGETNGVKILVKANVELEV
jgi:hypothetical protein